MLKKISFKSSNLAKQCWQHFWNVYTIRQVVGLSKHGLVMRLNIQKLSPGIEYAACSILKNRYISPTTKKFYLLFEVVFTRAHPNHGIESREFASSVDYLLLLMLPTCSR